MALRTRTIVDQRAAAVELLAEGVAVSEVAERFGVSRQGVYNWIERHRADPQRGLNDRSRKPHTSPTRTAEAIEQRVVAERRRWGFGSKKILRRLQDEEADVAWPPRSTIDAIFKRAGLVGGRRTPRPAVRTDRSLSPHVRRLRGRRSDDGRLQGTVPAAERQLLLPVAGSRSGEQVSARVRCLRLHLARTALGHVRSRVPRYGIQPVYSRPGRPGDKRRHERLNRTLLESTVIDPAYTNDGQQALFDEFRRMFKNEERPHESLGQDRPASRHRP
jgi:transposase